MIGIICAMQLEADGIIALAESIETEEIYGMTFRRGTLGGQDVTVVVCGEGKVNAAMCATVLIDRYHPGAIINSGVAGALSPLVGVGDIVVGSKVVEHDMNMRALGYKQGEVCLPSATGASVCASTTASARSRARWRERRSVTSATAAAFRLLSSARSPTTSMRTRAWISSSSAALPPTKPSR